MKFELSQQIFGEGMLKHQISSKFVQWELRCSIQTCRQDTTYMTKLTLAFRNFANASDDTAKKVITREAIRTLRQLLYIIIIIIITY